MAIALPFPPGTRPVSPAWARTPLAQLARRIMQAPLFAGLDRLAPATIEGRTVLDDLTGPVIFAANHTSHLDSPVLLRALPASWRQRVAVAAAADYFFTRPWRGRGAALLFNAFPFARSSGMRAALDQCAALLAGGWSLLLYPEGTRSPSGALGPFRPGVGLLAARQGVPVVPIHLAGLHAVLPKGGRRLRPGPVRVRFGAPLLFASGTRAQAATATIEAAVRDLAGDPF